MGKKKNRVDMPLDAILPVLTSDGLGDDAFVRLGVFGGPREGLVSSSWTSETSAGSSSRRPSLLVSDLMVSQSSGEDAFEAGFSTLS